MKLLKTAAIFAALTATAIANAYTMPDNIWLTGWSTPNNETHMMYDVTARQKMTRVTEGVSENEREFVYAGYFDVGYVRFMFTPDQWGAAGAITSAKEMGIETTEGFEAPVIFNGETSTSDFVFAAAVEGYWKITLKLTSTEDKNAGTAKFEYLGAPGTYAYSFPTQIWMTGSATPTDNEPRTLMERTGYDTYEWTGDLSGDENQTKRFKFMGRPSGWELVDQFGPVENLCEITANEGKNAARSNVVAIQKVMKENEGLPAEQLNPKIDAEDKQFSVRESGKYHLTLKLQHSPENVATLTAVKITPTTVSELEAEDSEAVEEIYNLNGVKVSRENAVPGIYVVRKGSKAKKVVIK